MKTQAERDQEAAEDWIDRNPVTADEPRRKKAFLAGIAYRDANPVVSEDPALSWIDGCPDKTYGQEWFIAKTTWGDKVVLKALPEEFAYDYKTADDTYLMKDKIKCWMQFPDSDFLSAGIAHERAKLQKVRGALEFYADLDSWGHISPEKAEYSVIQDDLGDGNFDNGHGTDDMSVGGLRARKALALLDRKDSK